MKSYQYPNLVVVEDVDDASIKAMGLEHAVVGKVPDFATNDVTEDRIQAYFRDLYGFEIPLENIIRNGSDFLIKLASSLEYVLILTRGYFHDLKLSVMPWKRGYGSTAVTFESQFANLGTVDFDRIGWEARNPGVDPGGNHAVSIRISGIPAHLCNEVVVRKLLGEWCDIDQISFMRCICWVIAETQKLASIPAHANIGVKKVTESGCVVNVWPVWYNIIPIFHDAVQPRVQSEGTVASGRGT